jgi:hypothetical protein
LTSAVVGGEWSASFPGRLTPWEIIPGTRLIGAWVDPRAGLEDVEYRKFFLHRDSKFDPSVVQPVASRYTDYAIPTPNFYQENTYEDRDRYVNLLTVTEVHIFPICIQMTSVVKMMSLSLQYN